MTELDQSHSIHDIVRSHIKSVGVFVGYNVTDIDAVYSSLNKERSKEDFLQEFYDALPKGV